MEKGLNMNLFSLLALFLSSSSYAGLSVLSEKERFKDTSVVSVKRPKVSPKSVYPRNDDLKKLLESSKKVDQILLMKTNYPFVWDGSTLIKTGKAFRGVLLNSIVSTNLESPVLIRIKSGQGLPKGSKVLCLGQTKHRRVLTDCQKLILPTHEVQIAAQALNNDGSAGLKGDFYSGKEEYILGSVVTEAAKGLLAASQQGISTPIGEVVANSPRNNLRGAAIGGAQAISDVIKAEMQNKEPKVYINAGLEVLVFFKKEVNYEKNNSRI